MNRIQRKVSLSLSKEHFFLWADQDATALVLDSNKYPGQSQAFDFIVAKGVESLLMLSQTPGAFSQLEAFKNRVNDWIFGYLSYDLKNETESLVGSCKDYLEFPELLFFQPCKILFVKGQTVTFSYTKSCAWEMDKDILALKKIFCDKQKAYSAIRLYERTSKEQYLKKCNEIINKINNGDIYEINYCIEFYNEKAQITSPVDLFITLNDKHKKPFASFFKHDFFHILSFSPERFLKKQGEVLISQPIKGTTARGNSPQEDSRKILDLKNSIKERAENVMTVDLVRNDFSKIAQKKSVKVIEYCKIYRFETMHQMVSTIKCRIKQGLKTSDIIKHCFPMGSMTGSPKINAMKFIDWFEDQKRGVYSGAIGYISPTDDFDFNVMIRTLLYHSGKKYVSLSVGGAITALSSPESEYRECLLKAEVIRRILSEANHAGNKKISSQAAE